MSFKPGFNINAVECLYIHIWVFRTNINNTRRKKFLERIYSNIFFPIQKPADFLRMN